MQVACVTCISTAILRSYRFVCIQLVMCVFTRWSSKLSDSTQQAAADAGAGYRDKS